MSVKRPPGFTLIETVVAMTVAVTVGGLALNLLLGQQRRGDAQLLCVWFAPQRARA